MFGPIAPSLEDSRVRFEIMTNGDTFRHIARSTVVSILVAVIMSFFAMVVVFGLDLDATVRVGKVFIFGVAAPTFAALFICPLIAYPTILAIRDRNRMQIELQRLSQTDHLTNLFNRRGFDNAANAALEIAADSPLTVMMLDLDFFKKVNDEFGHDFGDAALVHVANVLREMKRENNFVVGRQGGEEFVVLLTGVTEAGSVTIAERIRIGCSQCPVVHDGKSAFITISVGVATTAGPVTSIAGLARRADSALYLAKRAGRDRVHAADPEMPLSIAA
jgi:diguanylate cyclase (GGDEF)-like protein